MHRDCTTYFTPARLAGYRARWVLNTHRIEGTTGFILLHTKADERVEALIDADILPAVLPLARWAAMRPQPGAGIYATGWRRRQPGNTAHTRQLLYLHRVVLEARGVHIAGKHVDHLNGNTLDCRHGNLALVTNAQNQRNRRSHRAERQLREALIALLRCPHTRQDCACKRMALKLIQG